MKKRKFNRINNEKQELMSRIRSLESNLKSSYRTNKLLMKKVKYYRDQLQQEYQNKCDEDSKTISLPYYILNS